MSNDLDLQPRSSFTYVYVLNFTMNKTKILFASADKTLKFSGYLWSVYVVIGKILNIVLKILYAIEQIFIIG